MKRKILTIVLIFVLLIQSGGLIYLHNKNDQLVTSDNSLFPVAESNEEKLNELEKITKNPLLSEKENIEKVTKNPKDINDIFITGWIPDWDIPDGLDTVQNNEGLFSGISPVWYWPNADGSLEDTTYTNDSEFINYSKNNGIELIPTITLFDTDILSSILNSPENMQRHIDEIVDVTVNGNYDGIDLDYESIYLKDKKLFFEFMEKLAVKLAENNKKFVFTVLAKWGDEVIYETLPQTRMVQDYKRISNLVDEIRIMSYEYSGRESTHYGPIAPLAWMEDTIQYAIYLGIPREKIVLGIHTYAYDYTDRPKMESLEYYPVYDPLSDKEMDGALALYSDIIDLTGVSVEFNEEWGEAIGSYQKAGINRFLVFPTDRSIELRKQLAADYGIKGVAFWRVGDEGELSL